MKANIRTSVPNADLFQRALACSPWKCCHLLQVQRLCQLLTQHGLVNLDEQLQLLRETSKERETTSNKGALHHAPYQQGEALFLFPLSNSANDSLNKHVCKDFQRTGKSSFETCSMATSASHFQIGSIHKSSLKKETVQMLC